MPNCEKCGKDYELTKEDKTIRKHIQFTVRLAGTLVNGIVPGLTDAIKNSKGCCNSCWHENTDSYTQALQGLIGKKKLSEGAAVLLGEDESPPYKKEAN